jgi:adenylyltransferase/sulfurtransferase
MVAMSIVVHIPSALRTYCEGASELTISTSSVRAALKLLEQSHPLLYGSVCDETGAVRQHVNLFVNDYFLRERDGLDTVLEPGDVLTIMPAVSGG